MMATACIGIAVSLIVAVTIAKTNERIADLDFVERANAALQTIQHHVDNAHGALFALRDLFDSTERPISVTEYQFFAQRLRQRIPGLRDTGWAPRVARADRDVFEQSVRANGAPNYRIWEREQNGASRPAPEREFYFPILFPDPVGIAPKVLGLNIAAEPTRLAAVLHSIAIRLPGSTPPLKLISVTDEETSGFLSFLPVFGKFSSSAEPRGVVYGVFAIAPLIENIFGAGFAAKDIGAYFYNSDKPTDARPIFWHSPTGESDQAPPAREELLGQRHVEGVLRIGSQIWGVILVPDPATIRSWLWSALMPLGIGLLITGLIEAYLLISMRRTAQLERLTEELHITAEMLAEKGEKLAHVARHDTLTGLRNRAGFAEDTFAFSCRDLSCAHVAVLMLDLDRFKAVNDTLGHAAGDILLCQVAERLRESVRENDIVVRLGGDEFAIVQADLAQPKSAESLAGRLISEVGQPYRIFDQDVEIGVSIGIAICDVTSFEIDGMLRSADLALYRAKAAGRGTWQIFTAGDDLQKQAQVA